MSPIEIVAAFFGLLSVWYTLREHVWCWPTGLINVALYVVVFFQARLYADTFLQVVFIFIQFYGWYEWLHGGPGKTELHVTRASGPLLALLLGVGAAGTAGMGYLWHYTDAALPYWDSAIMALSLVAQWMVAKKLLENWAFWIAVDVLAIGVYLNRALYPTTVLYVVYLALAIWGYREWWLGWRKAAEGPAPS